MPQADVRASGADLLARTGNPLTVTLTWPAGYLTGKSFASSFGGTAIAPAIAGDVMTLALTAAQTAALGNGRHTWTLTDTTGDDVVRIAGRLLLGTSSTDNPDTSLTVLTDTNVSVSVTVAVGVGLPLPSGTASVGRVPAVSDDDPLTLAWTDIGTQVELDAEAAARIAGDAASVATAATDATTKANAAQAAAVQRANHTGTQLAATISDFDAAAVAAGNGTYVSVFDIRAYGGVGDGITDNTAALNAALAAAYAAGGGVIRIPKTLVHHTFRADSKITLPNDGHVSAPHQPSIKIVGDVARFGNRLANAIDAVGGSVLDLRYSGSGAKIVTLGQGTLTFGDITLADFGTSSTPFVLTTNTVLRTEGLVSVQGNTTKSGSACDQDAFVLGGTTAAYGADETAPFAGWGTVISGVTFSHIRRGVHGRAWCNNVIVQNCTWDVSCGSDNTAAAIEFDGSVGFAHSNVTSGNLIEAVNYVYGIIYRDSVRNRSFGDAFWDPGGSFVSCFRLAGASSGENMATGCDGPPTQLYTSTGSSTMLITNRGVAAGVWVFAGGPSGGADAVTIRPSVAGTATTATMWAVRRSLSEGTDANGIIAKLTHHGQLTLRGPAASSAVLLVEQDGVTGKVSIDRTSIVKDSGHLDLYAGADTSGIRARRGLIANRTLTTAARPAASVGAGFCYYDTTLSKPVWSDGATWRDAAGVAV